MQRAVYGIIVAGGSGSRYGGDVPKQYLPLGTEGRVVLMYAIDALRGVCPDENIRVVIAEDMSQLWAQLCANAGYTSPQVVYGGATRWHSVRNALDTIEPCEGDVVLVHDGARPAVPSAVVEAVVKATIEQRAAVPAVSVTDSLRCVDAEGVSHAVDRSRYFAVQTPQGFDAMKLKQAYCAPYSPLFTDDASVYEHTFALPVAMVPGSVSNIKITHAGDIERISDVSHVK